MSSQILLEIEKKLRKMAERFDDQEALDDLDLAVSILDGMVSTINNSSLPDHIKSKDVDIRLGEAKKVIRRAFSRLAHLVEKEN